MSEVRDLQSALDSITVGKSALVECPESLKKEQISFIHERLRNMSDEPDPAMKKYWQGMAMGEMCMLARLEIISLHESYVLRNLVCEAAGEREPHGALDLALALKLDARGVRFR